jgi:hypothetical protein
MCCHTKVENEWIGGLPMFVHEHQLHGHDEIVRLLEGIKKKGLISEYLVTWNGSEGQLTPKIMVWQDADTGAVQYVKGRITQTFYGLIPAERIEIVADS